MAQVTHASNARAYRDCRPRWACCGSWLTVLAPSTSRETRHGARGTSRSGICSRHHPQHIKWRRIVVSSGSGPPVRRNAAAAEAAGDRIVGVGV